MHLLAQRSLLRMCMSMPACMITCELVLAAVSSHVSYACALADFYVFYAFYAWWDYFLQLGALSEGTSRICTVALQL
jgi:hypothetical protein